MLFNTSSNFKYLLVGLGNPTAKYSGTRHNVGFDALDEIASKYKVDIKKIKFSAMYGTGEINGVKVVMLKPQTFMNLSGEAVGAAAKFYKIEPENVIILCDDVSLDAGVLRIRKSGSAGGHNGLKSIIASIGSQFVRVKIGVGQKPHPDYDLADWVLSKPSTKEAQDIKARFDDICVGVSLILQGNVQKAMNLCNISIG